VISSSGTASSTVCSGIAIVAITPASSSRSRIHRARTK
jgi:hypothetical protein